MRLVIEGSCWLLSLTAMMATVAMSVGAPSGRGGQTSVRDGRHPASVVSADSLADANEIVVRQNLFRPSRAPSDIEFGSPEEIGAVETTPPRPRLVLSGIIGGPPWSALLDGVPGKEGTTLVQRGDTLAGLRVLSVSARGVVVVGLDTTWTLTLDRESP